MFKCKKYKLTGLERVLSCVFEHKGGFGAGLKILVINKEYYSQGSANIGWEHFNCQTLCPKCPCIKKI